MSLYDDASFNAAWNKLPLQDNKLPLLFAHQLVNSYEGECDMATPDPVVNEELSLMILEIETNLSCRSDLILLSKQEHIILVDLILLDVALRDLCDCDYDSDDTISTVASSFQNEYQKADYNEVSSPESTESPTPDKEVTSTANTETSFELKKSLTDLQAFNTIISSQFENHTASLTQIRLKNAALFERLQVLEKYNSLIFERIGMIQQSVASAQETSPIKSATFEVDKPSPTTGFVRKLINKYEHKLEEDIVEEKSIDINQVVILGVIVMLTLVIAS